MKVLFRAKTIRQDFEEEMESLKCIDGIWYAFGTYIPIYNSREEEIESYIQRSEKISDMEIYSGKRNANTIILTEVAPETKAIHIEDMRDSEDNPIFASLDKEKGIGGDMLNCWIGSNHQDSKPTRKMVFKYQFPHRFTIGVCDIEAYAVKKVIGIKQ